MLEGLTIARQFKSYVGVKGAAAKLERYLTDFRFTDVATAAHLVEWEKAQVVEL